MRGAQPIARPLQAGLHGSRCAALPSQAGQPAAAASGCALPPPLLPNDGQHQWPLQVTNAAALCRAICGSLMNHSCTGATPISLLDLTLSRGARPAQHRLSLHHVCPSACTCLCTPCLGAHSSPCTASHAHRSPYLRPAPLACQQSVFACPATAPAACLPIDLVLTSKLVMPGCCQAVHAAR